jgi:hypothetical protein
LDKDNVPSRKADSGVPPRCNYTRDRNNPLSFPNIIFLYASILGYVGHEGYIDLAKITRHINNPAVNPNPYRAV